MNLTFGDKDQICSPVTTYHHTVSLSYYPQAVWGQPVFSDRQEWTHESSLQEILTRMSRLELGTDMQKLAPTGAPTGKYLGLRN